MGTLINDRPLIRWSVLIIVAFTMMMGYFITDVISPLETLLEMPAHEGGLGWSPSDYGFFSGASGFINVFLLMLFFSGLILDHMGVRFTGVLSCSLMIAGVLLKLYAFTAPSLAGETYRLSVWAYQLELPRSVALASLGFAVFGVGYEMCGITVSKVMVRWFTGHELALAMGIQLALARLGTALALSVSAPLARQYAISTPLLVGLAFLCIGLLFYLVFCVMDRRLDKSRAWTAAAAADDQFHLSDIGAILRNPGFWLITLFCVLFYSAVSPFLKFASRLMIVKYGVDADLAGFFTSIAPFGTILLTPLFGSVYDRYGRGVTLIITGTVMLTAVHLGFALPFHSSAMAILLMLLLSIAYSLVPSSLWPCVPKIIPLRCLGTAYSLIFYIQNMGRSIIPMLVGHANESDPSYTSSMLIFAATATGAVVVAVALLFTDRHKHYGLQLPNIKS